MYNNLHYTNNILYYQQITGRDKTMAKKYSIDFFIKLAQSKSGECLSKEYKNIHEKLEWRCSRGHVWEATANSVKRGSWCPICYLESKKVINNDELSKKKLREMQELAIRRGGRCLSRQYTNNKTKLQWECDKGHVWEAMPYLIKSGYWCTVCVLKNRKIMNNNKLLRKKMSEISTLENQKNVKFLSKFAGVNLEYDWKCKDCNTIFKRTISNMKRSAGCPVCVKRSISKNLCKHSIEEMREIANKRNGECLSLEYVNFTTKLTWKCNICNNIWDNTPAMILQGQWCPKCAVEKRKVCNNKELQKERLAELNAIAERRGGKCLATEYKGSSVKLTWQCQKGHIWEAIPNSIKKGSWCPICNGQPSYTIQDMRDYARKKGGDCLSKTYVNSQEKLLWKCFYGHVWEASQNNIFNGYWCPVCSKTIRLNESKCKFIFEELTGARFTKNRTILGDGLELDGYNPNLKLAFEYQGEQHYMPVKLFNIDKERVEQIKKTDYVKKKICDERNIKLIVIPFSQASTDNKLLNYITNQLKRTGHFNENKYKDFSFSAYYRNLPALCELKELVESRGGKIISIEYYGETRKLEYECEHGHRWQTTPSKIRLGTWCPRCHIEKMNNIRRGGRTINDMRDLAKVKGGKCLSDEYISVNHKLIWQCQKGHVWEAIPLSIQNGHWCPKCAKNKKLSIEEMHEIAKKRSGKCLSTEYVNARTKLKWQCEHGHIWEAVPDSVKRGTWCPVCARRKGS
jgi:hypothetical protein